MTVGTLRGMMVGAGALAGLAFIAPKAVHAQAQTSGTRFGVEADYADHFNLGIGAFVKFHLADMSGHPITGRASFDYFFPGNGDFCDGDPLCDDNFSQHYWTIGADALYDISSKGNVKPYVGAGLQLDHYSVSCDGCGDDFGGTGGLGLNILGGINFMADSKLMPFVEVKLGIAGGVGDFGGTVFTLKGGIHF